MPLFTVTVFAFGILFGIIIAYSFIKIFGMQHNNHCNSSDTTLMLSLVERNHALCREMEILKRKHHLKDNSCHF